jgi:two-component system, response regulator PdtaR
MTRSLRIAVADDEPDVLDYFRRILPLLGHEVVAAADNGLGLVESCRQQQPDLIIADVRMPGLDGDDAVQQICQERPTPFILISAFSKPDCIPRAGLPNSGLDASRWAYLTKPVKRDDLEGAISRLFGTNGSR